MLSFSPGSSASLRSAPASSTQALSFRQNTSYTGGAASSVFSENKRSTTMNRTDIFEKNYKEAET
ncbi:MAG TPA: hypothetical protein PLH98_02025 [Ruminococcus flavefaciens]|nr:hypothetical protein [Ruminococcus flavefaciens]HQL99327.1 hypothetical protein [Ruminococcus flavefaciens]